MKKIDLDTEKKFLEADKLRNKNQFKDAINILDKIIKKYPEFLPALNNIALNYVNIKNFIEAEKYYSICLNLKPEELIFINNLAKVFHDTNQYKKALPLLQKSLMKNKEQLDIIKITAKCLFELDLTKDLDIFLSKVLKKYSDDITLKYYYGKNLLKINKHIEGLNMLKKTLGVIEFDKKKFKII
jgi:tetratricopeptide (TPR) repeat protein|tara:strand:- start:1457 stop:2011 length:555 start_codon:yes stop_codon:yes gene_type:complete